MKTIRFTAYPDGYRCSEPGDQSGEYVKASRVDPLMNALRRVAQVMNHQTFTCANGTFNDLCPKCVVNQALEKAGPL